MLREYWRPKTGQGAVAELRGGFPRRQMRGDVVGSLARATLSINSVAISFRWRWLLAIELPVEFLARG